MTDGAPMIEGFLELLAREGGAWAPAKREAFLRICEACADADGLPSDVGLRQLERGQFDSRLDEDWRPVFRDTYRQWLGFRMEREFLRPAPPFSLRWWFTGPAAIRSMVRSPLSRLVSPAAALVAALAVLAVTLSGSVLAHRARASRIGRALALQEEAIRAVVDLEREVTTWLDRGDDGSLARILAHRTLLRSAEAELARRTAEVRRVVEGDEGRTRGSSPRR